MLSYSTIVFNLHKTLISLQQNPLPCLPKTPQFNPQKTMKRLRSIPFPNLHPLKPPNPNLIPSKPIHNLTQKSNPPIPKSQWSYTPFARESTSTSSTPPPSERVSSLVDEMTGLTLLECMDLVEILRKKLGLEELPVMTMMMPGMGLGVGGKAGGGAKAEEKVEEKTAFDLKLEGFEAASKIKVIKEVRTFTDLGLKEAKELVEKAPTLLKKGVSKEEAGKIIEKMKELGAKVVME